MKKKLIVAFTGRMASGKGTASAFFVDRYEAQTIRFSDVLRDILSRLSLEQSRGNLQELSRILREGFGQDTLARVIAHDVEALDAQFIILDGARRVADVSHLKKIDGFTLIAVEAQERTRFERLQGRDENPDDAKKTWEEFLEEEKADAEILIPELMEQADYTVDNNGDVPALEKQLVDLFEKLSNEDKN